MNVRETRLDGVVVFEPKVYRDDRGYLTEVWNRGRYVEAGLDVSFVQDNLSMSRKGVLRGLHFQWPNAQGKLVSVLQGEVFDVAVDVRSDSETRGKWVGETLSAENRRQIFVPPGFAHGFVVLSESALVLYKCTALYTPSDEASVAWDDPAFAIAWPVEKPFLAAKDASAPRLDALDPARVPSKSRRPSLG